jgi:predicted nucleotidyltransferase
VTLIQLTKEKKFEVARLVDREIRDILEYMLMKYPPSRKKIVDTDLAVKIK